MRMKYYGAIFLAILFCSAIILPAHNVFAKDIVLKFATGFSPKHTMQTKVFEPWAEKISNMTNGTFSGDLYIAYTVTRQAAATEGVGNGTTAEERKDRILSLTTGRGVDVVIEAAGHRLVSDAPVAQGGDDLGQRLDALFPRHFAGGQLHGFDGGQLL